MDANRLQKIANAVLKECKEDRTKALATHDYFKDMVETNPTDSVAKNLMVDCLKLAQQSKTNVIKMVDLLIKLDVQVRTKSGGSNSAFEELASLIDE